MRRQVHDPYSDAQHCGPPELASEPWPEQPGGRDHICVNGSCALGCEAGKVRCRGHCIDPLTDAAFCGASADRTGANAGANCQAPPGRCGSMTTAQCQADAAAPAAPATKRDSYSPARSSSLTLPACVTEITVKASGARAVTARAAAWVAAAPPSRERPAFPRRDASIRWRDAAPPNIPPAEVAAAMSPRNYAALCRGGGGGAYASGAAAPR